MNALAVLTVRVFAVIGAVVTGWTAYCMLARYTSLFERRDPWHE